MDLDLLTAAELGERLRLKPDTLILWARQGRIPAQRLSRKVIRFRLPDVIDALNAAPGLAPSHQPPQGSEPDR